MKILFLLWLPFASLFTSKHPPQNSKWKFVDPLGNQKLKETRRYSLKETILPFVWANFRYSTIDSMILRGREYDSLAKIGLLDHPENMVDGVMAFLPDSTRLFYASTNTVKIDKCEYTYQTFEIYPKLQVGGENIYELFYLKGLGFFSAIYVDVEHKKKEWKHYALEDLVDKKGKSVVDKSKLKALADSILLRRLGS